MTTGHVFIAVSLDGFISRANGDIDWLSGWPEAGHDYGFAEFMAAVDGLVMGRGTFETAMTFEAWPYTKPVVVMSRTLQEGDLRQDLAGKVRITRAGPGEVMRDLEREGWKRVYVDGGLVVQSFLREGLIEDMVLTRVPILIGAGRPLFGELARDIRLRHLDTSAYASGFVQSRYAIQR